MNSLYLTKVPGKPLFRFISNLLHRLRAIASFGRRYNMATRHSRADMSIIGLYSDTDSPTVCDVPAPSHGQTREEHLHKARRGSNKKDMHLGNLGDRTKLTEKYK